MSVRSFFMAGVACVQMTQGAALPEGVVNTQKPGDQPLSPQEALKKITVPPGFRVELFAGEPDVYQPIAFDFDDRGRLWVIECFSYPDFKQENRDRVLIFEDRDNDGRFDSRKVFLEGGHRLTGITLGFGGVWLCSSPNLIFIPDANADDIPDGPPVIELEGFTLKAEHNVVNGLAWGPDGWLYGRHGILQNSLVGRPGTPEKDRVPLNCSIWRYHPTRKTFEVAAHGTTNPWGLDWDEHGQPFFSNNVIGHLWHLVAGAHYERMYGSDFNPHSYELMNSTSDHLHWTGADWRKSRTGAEHALLGGGHAHAGAMIYQGDNWPDEFRQTLMMVNIHGHRLLYDRLERKGSTYSAKHGGDFLMANDDWFRGVMLGYGPDGGVFLTDWNDLGECHDYDGTFRGSGRIYKITYGTLKAQAVSDLAKLSDGALVEMQLHKNEWFVRHARRLLQERSAAGKLGTGARKELQAILRDHRDVTRQLRALWALNVIGGLDDAELNRLLTDANEHIRWWALTLLCERKPAPSTLEKIARTDSSPLVRLGVASALQRLKHEDRFAVAQTLLQRAEDASDPMIPLMIWYGLEPAIESHPGRGADLLGECRMPQVRQFIARRLAAGYQLSGN